LKTLSAIHGKVKQEKASCSPDYRYSKDNQFQQEMCVRYIHIKLFVEVLDRWGASPGRLDGLWLSSFGGKRICFWSKRMKKISLKILWQMRIFLE
jgi:hypothetical protein